MRQPWRSANPAKILSLAVRGARGATVADHDHLDNLAQLALALRGSGQLTRTTVPTSGSTDMPGLGSALLWDKPKSAALFASLREDSQ